MPTNLNALIRYKQIDKCLKSPYTDCTIEKLREVCSGALNEYRGINRLISERTIRDDIRIMRSDILGFNAPIIFEEGRYIYGIPHFTLFNRSILNLDLLEDIFYFLKKEELNSVEANRIQSRIANILGRPAETEGDAKYKLIRPHDYLNMRPELIAEIFNIDDSEDDIYDLSNDLKSKEEPDKYKLGANKATDINKENSTSKRRLAISDKLVIDWGDVLKLI